MMRFFLALCCVVIIEEAGAQSMFLPQQNKHQQFLERLEILLQSNPTLNTETPKTLTRHSAVFIAGMEDSSSGNPSIRLSKVDQENLRDLLMNNAEYVTRAKGEGLYSNPANLYEINKEGFFLAVNPLFSAGAGLPKANDRNIFHTAAGVNFRSLINNNLGFYASVTHNTESPPDFARERFETFNSVPGANRFRLGSDGTYKYWDVRAGITFEAAKFFDFQLAYDRNFIGNGYRSLYLSDFGSNYLFAKMNTRVWKFRYQHLYATMVPQFSGDRSGKGPFGRKVVAMHHLNINLTKWLNVAAFQALTISSGNDWHFMIPVMFYPVSRLNNNKPDNDLAGFEFKANIAKRAQVYGQLLLDNFRFKELTKGDRWWNNRFGYQVGLKYINLFNVDNLDVQLEWNSVRPYTYATEDSLGNYTHFNNQIAHPFGANFSEGVALVRYQPFKELTTSLRMIMWKQGIDSSAKNFGSNIFKSTDTRPAEYGFGIPTGVNAVGSNVELAASYEVFQNLFVDAALLVRNVTFERNYFQDASTVFGSLGIRMNLFRKRYDY